MSIVVSDFGRYKQRQEERGKKKMKYLILIVLTLSTGCASLNTIKHERLTDDTFRIKQSMSSDILCIRKSKTETKCYHVTGKGE